MNYLYLNILHQGLAEWNVPQGGMFLWIKCLGISDTKSMIMERALKKDVILLPGREFMTDGSIPCPYMRASFSLAAPETIDRVRADFYMHDDNCINFNISFLRGSKI